MSPPELPFRELVDAAPDGLIVCDQQGTILLANAEACRMFGYEREELVGSRIDRLVPASVRPRHDAYVAAFTSAPRLRPMGSGLDLHGCRKDGTEFPVEISLSPIKTVQGLLVTAGIRDTTERRALEGDKRRANAYLTSAVDAVQDAFALFDEQDRVVMVNSACRQLFGRTLGKSIVGESFPNVLAHAIDDGTFALGDESRAELEARWLAYHRSPAGTLDVRTSTGRFLRVTERKTAEQGTVSLIVDVTDDVHRAEELSVAREAAEAASAAKSEFLSSMSHELRTPLNAILGFAQLLERDRKNPLDTRQLERLRHVLRGGEHLLRLIDDVLDLAKIEAGGITISIEPVELAEVLAQVVTTLEPMATRAQIAIAPLQLATASLRVRADRTRLAQILMNFGSNAIKYGKRGGRVELRVERHPTSVRVSVVDDGIGIPAAQQARLFEPFQRAGQEAGPIEGTGIGLTISKRLAELMRGGVGFTSTEGAGSEFWIDVPLDTEASEPAVAPSTRPAAVPAPSPTGPAQLVVYVEDNPSNIAFMQDLLADLPNIELVTAPTAEIGLALIRARLPRLVLMDINLPGMSGFDAVGQLRAWPETRNLPVIGLSAAALMKDRDRARNAGFDRYLTKPVNLDELLDALGELLK
ncbi:MAG: PAS domain S-box protein [Kofleriaceae bacterium]|nr:PAS domain S-box protein [Kofleriaceae bacterium]